MFVHFVRKVGTGGRANVLNGLFRNVQNFVHFDGLGTGFGTCDGAFVCRSLLTGTSDFSRFVVTRTPALSTSVAAVFGKGDIPSPWVGCVCGQQCVPASAGQFAGSSCVARGAAAWMSCGPGCCRIISLRVLSLFNSQGTVFGFGWKLC